MAPLAKGIGKIKDDCLCVVIPPELAKLLKVEEGILVIVDNVNGKLTIARSAANGWSDQPCRVGSDETQRKRLAGSRSSSLRMRPDCHSGREHKSGSSAVRFVNTCVESSPCPVGCRPTRLTREGRERNSATSGTLGHLAGSMTTSFQSDAVSN